MLKSLYNTFHYMSEQEGFEVASDDDGPRSRSWNDPFFDEDDTLYKEWVKSLKRKELHFLLAETDIEDPHAWVKKQNTPSYQREPEAVVSQASGRVKKFGYWFIKKLF